MATPRLLALPALLLGLSVGGDQAIPNRLAGSTPSAATTRPYNHDRFVTLPVDIRRSFTAFVVSFDGADGERCLGVPEWVAYELRKSPAEAGDVVHRGRWKTDPVLFAGRIAPGDASYAGSGYSRGHMCMKSHAGRISADADEETHTVLNACPQLQGMNNGVWKAIENLTGRWADVHEAVWIITGPVFYANKTTAWIGDDDEVPVAIPDAFFKVVVRPQAAGWLTMAFLVPMHGDEFHHKSAADVRPYLTSIDTIEALTGLDFLTSLPDQQEEELERAIFTILWEDR